MNRKWMAGIAVGILVAAALILVGVGAYRAGERNGDDVAVVGQVLSESDSAGHTIIVDGHGWHGGPGFFFPGFFVFPLIIIGLVLLFASRRGGWGGPGRYRCGEAELAEWHRRAHADERCHPGYVAAPGPA